ncbi:MAG: transporter permease subunit [Clostridia bacterium]|nr:transporter permease subunit [Clostridia bacterium]
MKVETGNLKNEKDIILNKEESKNDNKELELLSVHVVTPGQLVIKRFLRNKLAIIGIIILIIMTIFSYLGPLFSPYGEYELFYKNSEGVELYGETLDYNSKDRIIFVKAPISARHWLGTDRDGRDVLTRLMYGGRISLTIGFAATFLELILGVFLGGLAGYYGKWVDSLIMRLVDIFYCIPTLPIMLILASVMIALKVDQQMKIYYLMIILGILGWAGVARLVRGQILSLREQEFMIATEAIGLRPMRKIFKHLVPNVMPQLIVIATLGVGGVILTESALSYLGLGLAFPYASWGNMVNTVTDPNIMSKFLNIWIPPGTCILFTVMAFNFVGDGLRDAFDPKMKR